MSIFEKIMSLWMFGGFSFICGMFYGHYQAAKDEKNRSTTRVFYTNNPSGE